jgi:hypothetical protein
MLICCPVFACFRPAFAALHERWRGRMARTPHAHASRIIHAKHQ